MHSAVTYHRPKLPEQCHPSIPIRQVHLSGILRRHRALPHRDGRSIHPIVVDHHPTGPMDTCPVPTVVEVVDHHHPPIIPWRHRHMGIIRHNHHHHNSKPIQGTGIQPRDRICRTDTTDRRGCPTTELRRAFIHRNECHQLPTTKYRCHRDPVPPLLTRLRTYTNSQHNNNSNYNKILPRPVGPMSTHCQRPCRILNNKNYPI